MHGAGRGRVDVGGGRGARPPGRARVRLDGAGLLAAQHLADAAAAGSRCPSSTCRSSPAASSRWHRPVGGRARARRRGCGRSVSPRAAGPAVRAAGRRGASSASAISCAGRSASSRMAWPGYQGRPAAASAATRTAASPHTSARSRRSSRAVGTASSSARSPISATSLATGTAVVSACSTSSASSTASRRKSRSSVAALTDWRACGPRGQRRDAARRRLGEVGPQLQQPDQPLVGQLGQPGAQRQGCRSGSVGHC